MSDKPLTPEERVDLARTMIIMGAQMPTVRKAFARYEATLQVAEEWVEKAEQELAKVRAERDRYRQALDFYADEKNYDDSGTPGKVISVDTIDYGTDWDLDPDFGQRAREALGREAAKHE